MINYIIELNSGSNFNLLERPSDKWSNSFSRISWVTHGNREEECHGKASGWLKPYQLILKIYPYITFTFPILIVIINYQ